jgi:nucleotide-binding universal stress UspA family protein
MSACFLVPLDGSPTSTRGLHEAIRLAAALHGRLRLLHVIDDFHASDESRPRAPFEEMLAALRHWADALVAGGRAQAAAAGVPAEVCVRQVAQRSVADVIAEEAESAGCELIVLGTHGRRGIGRWMLGSRAEEIARASPVPVLMVRHAPPGA